MRRTKIVVTLGRASSSADVIRRLIIAGMRPRGSNVLKNHSIH
jgi:pyruvate kinase